MPDAKPWLPKRTNSPKSDTTRDRRLLRGFFVKRSGFALFPKRALLVCRRLASALVPGLRSRFFRMAFAGCFPIGAGEFDKEGVHLQTIGLRPDFAAVLGDDAPRDG